MAMLTVLLACAPEPTTVSSSATGHTEVVFDTAGFGIAPEDVVSVTVGGTPAYRLRTTGGGRLAMTTQGGPSGAAEVAVTTATDAGVVVGVVDFLPPADPLFDRMAALGASVSMGFQSGAASPHAQLASPPMMMARGAGAWLPVPLFREEYWGVLTLDDIGPAPDCTLKNPGTFTTTNVVNILAEVYSDDLGGYDFPSVRVSPEVPFHNVAIGGYQLTEIVHGVEGGSTSSLMAYLMGDNGAMVLGDDPGPSQLERIEAIEPTLIVSPDLYGNDALLSSLEPGGVEWDRLTDPEDLRLDLQIALERLSATGAEVFIGNLPDIEELPRILQAEHDPEELATVLATIEEYNAILDEEAAKWPNVYVVDQYGFVAENTAGGVDAGSFSLSLGTLGGLISYDGVHFSGTTNALIADFFLERMHEELGIPRAEVDVVDALLRDPHSPLAVEAQGRDPEACAH